MTIGYEELRRENEELKEEVMRLKHELELRGGAEPEKEGVPRVVFIAGRRKGTGARYDILKLGSIHRKILYALLEAGAVSEGAGIPAVEIRRGLRISQGSMAGRVSELIRKNYIKANRVRINFQLIGGTLVYRPETEIDPNLGIKSYRRFKYWITDSGKDALLREVRPTDEFAKADLGTLIELKRAVEEKQKA